MISGYPKNYITHGGLWFLFLSLILKVSVHYSIDLMSGPVTTTGHRGDEPIQQNTLKINIRHVSIII